MCMLSSDVALDAKDTQILVYHTDAGNAQVTVYQNAFKTPDVRAFERAPPSAMILPVPLGDNDGADAIELIDLSDNPEFFTKLSELKWIDPAATRSFSYDDLCWHGGPLPTIVFGAYTCSIAATAQQLERISDTFKITDAVRCAVQENYHTNFGFIVAQFDSANLKEPHALAYRHPIVHDVDDPKAPPQGRLFIPMRHVHGNAIVMPIEEFDHNVYVFQHVIESPFYAPPARYCPTPHYLPADEVRSVLPAALLSDATKPSVPTAGTKCFRFELTGRHPNQDGTTRCIDAQ